MVAVSRIPNDLAVADDGVVVNRQLLDRLRARSKDPGPLAHEQRAPRQIDVAVPQSRVLDWCQRAKKSGSTCSATWSDKRNCGCLGPRRPWEDEVLRKGVRQSRPSVPATPVAESLIRSWTWRLQTDLTHARLEEEATEHCAAAQRARQALARSRARQAADAHCRSLTTRLREVRPIRERFGSCLDGTDRTQDLVLEHAIDLRSKAQAAAAELCGVRAQTLLEVAAEEGGVPESPPAGYAVRLAARMASLESEELLQRLGAIAGDPQEKEDKEEAKSREEEEGKTSQLVEMEATTEEEDSSVPLWLNRDAVRAEVASALEASDALLSRLGFLDIGGQQVLDSAYNHLAGPPTVEPAVK